MCVLFAHSAVLELRTRGCESELGGCVERCYRFFRRRIRRLYLMFLIELGVEVVVIHASELPSTHCAHAIDRACARLLFVVCVFVRSAFAY